MKHPVSNVNELIEFITTVDANEIIRNIQTLFSGSVAELAVVWTPLVEGTLLNIFTLKILNY